MKGQADTVRCGFTLIEIIVALLVFEVMLLGAVGLLRLGIVRAGAAELTERVTWEVLAMADSLARGPDGALASGGSSERPWGVLRWDAGTVEAIDAAGRFLLRVELGPRVAAAPSAPDPAGP